MEVAEEEISPEEEGEWRSLQRFGLLRTMAFAVVIVVAAGFTFAVARTVARVPKNTEAIDANCHARNKQLEAVNKKFWDLNLLIDQFAKERAQQGRPFSDEAMRLIGEFRKPIPLSPCKTLLNKP